MQTTDCRSCKRIGFIRSSYSKCRACTEAVIGVGNQQCRICRKIANSSEFHGLYCKSCRNKKVKQYLNSAERKEASRKWVRDAYLRMKNDPVKYAQYLAKKRENYAKKKEGVAE